MTGVGVVREQEVPAKNRRCNVGEAVIQCPLDGGVREVIGPPALQIVRMLFKKFP